MNESYKRIDPVRVEMFKFVGLQLGNVAKSRVLLSEVPVWWLVKNEDMPRQHSRQWVFSTVRCNGKPRYGVKTPLVFVPTWTTVMIMNLLVILIVLMLLFGGGGFYLGGPMVGGGGFGLILLILLVLFFTGNLSRK
jgi:hypothetical protein